MAAAALTSSAGDLGNMASQMLGIKSTSDIFAGILSSRTVQDKLIQEFDSEANLLGSPHGRCANGLSRSTPASLWTARVKSSRSA